MLGVILNVMKHQSSVTGMELNMFAPPPPQFIDYLSAAMMVQSILENKRVGLSRVAVHAITKNWKGGGGGRRHTFYSKITSSNDSP